MTAQTPTPEGERERTPVGAEVASAPGVEAPTYRTADEVFTVFTTATGHRGTTIDDEGETECILEGHVEHAVAVAAWHEHRLTGEFSAEENAEREERRPVTSEHRWLIAAEHSPGCDCGPDESNCNDEYAWWANFVAAPVDPSLSGALPVTVIA